MMAPIMAWTLIGSIVGVLLGLTGSGGAMIAVPLFLSWTDMSLPQATFYSLYAVVAGAALNWLVQRHHTQLTQGVMLAVFSIPGSWAAAQYKFLIPAFYLKLLFIGVALGGLAALWIKKSSSQGKSSTPASLKKELLQGSVGGFLAGNLVTLTGLGGGIILVPLLRGIFGLPLSRATATSLLTVTLTALSSLAFQSSKFTGSIPWEAILFLLLGSVIASLFTRQAIRHIHSVHLDRVRIWLVTFVILFSVGSLLLKH